MILFSLIPLRELTEDLSDPVAFTQEVRSTQVPVPAPVQAAAHAHSVTLRPLR